MSNSKLTFIGYQKCDIKEFRKSGKSWLILAGRKITLLQSSNAIISQSVKSKLLKFVPHIDIVVLFKIVQLDMFFEKKTVKEH